MELDLFLMMLTIIFLDNAEFLEYMILIMLLILETQLAMGMLFMNLHLTKHIIPLVLEEQTRIQLN